MVALTGAFGPGRNNHTPVAAAPVASPPADPPAPAPVAPADPPPATVDLTSASPGVYGMQQQPAFQAPVNLAPTTPAAGSLGDYALVGATAVGVGAALATESFPAAGAIAVGNYASSPQSFSNVANDFGAGMTTQMQIMQDPAFYGLYGIN